jgi:hypothetical protein
LRIERAFGGRTKQVEAPHFETAAQGGQRGAVLFDQRYHEPNPTRSPKLLQVDWPCEWHGRCGAMAGQLSRRGTPSLASLNAILSTLGLKLRLAAG